MAFQECHKLLNVVNCSKLELRGVQLPQNLDRAVDSRRSVNGGKQEV
jgi:hypothetical protein